MLYLSSVVVIIIASCTRELVRQEKSISPMDIPRELAMATAQGYVEENYSQASFEIHWNEALVHRSDTAYYVETPVTGIDLPFLTPQAVNKYPIRMVVKVKKNAIDARLMYITPHQSSINANEITYANIGEFTGNISYFQLDRQPSHALVFKKGEVVSMLFYQGKNDNQAQKMYQVINTTSVLGKTCYTDMEKISFITLTGLDDFYKDEMRSDVSGDECWLRSDNLDDVVINPPKRGGGNNGDGDVTITPRLPGGNDGFIPPIGETEPTDGAVSGLKIPTPYEMKIMVLSDSVKKLLPPEIQSIIKDAVIEYKEGNTSDGNIAETQIVRDANGKVTKYVVTVKPWLTDEQLKTVLGHELQVHIYPFELQWAAGTVAALNKTNPALAKCLDDTKTYDTNDYEKKNAKYDYNKAHHEYAALNRELIRQLLKSLYPARANDNDFIDALSCGSLTKTKYFNDTTNVSRDYKIKIQDYLLDLEL
ncbi:MAG: hypothetical protein PHD21_01115 [Flavobacteriales bacterium]|nr:hypothetical protein [Flavobacteriales bacterium]